MALYSSLSAVLVPTSVCGGKQMATNNIDQNSLGRQCGLQLIIRYSTSGDQYLETSLMLDIAHQQLLTNRHTLPPLILPDIAALSCQCTEKPDSSILSVSSFSQVSVKHKILQFLMSRWQDSLNPRSSRLFSSDCTLANNTEGSGGLPTRRQVLTRHPAL